MNWYDQLNAPATSGYGTNAKSSEVRRTTAIGGKADVTRTSENRRD
jgi:hypothetical protein